MKQSNKKHILARYLLVVGFMLMFSSLIIYDTFTRLGLHRFRIRVNNRKVLNGFFAILHHRD